MRPSLLLLALLLAAPAPWSGQGQALAQPTGAEFVTSALLRPLGLTVDAAGRVWVAESGTTPTSNDGRISVVLPDGQVFPFLTGIATGGTPAERRGVNHVALAGTDLWFTSSVTGTATFLQRISTAGFTPGDPPRTPADVAQTVEVGAFIAAQGIPDSNPYGLAVGPDGALYVADAGANVLLRCDRATGALTVHATFPPLPNPTPVGPPVVQAVPTGVVAADGRLYVAALTGFPFAEGLARVYAVEADGTFTVHRGGLTAVADLARDPRGSGALTALQHGVFGFAPPPPGWRPGTGRALRLADDRALAAAFDFASGAAYAADGTLYVATLGNALYRVASPTAATLVVNSAADPGTGACDAAECTLREAINASNSSLPNDVIHFDIPGAGVRSITPLTALPALTDTVAINGYSQPGALPNTLETGNNAVLLVELNGNGAAFSALTLSSGGSTVRGLVINRFGRNGLELRTGGGNAIAGTWIGTSADGAAAQNNGLAGIYIEDSAGNTIGGTSPADRNVILGSLNPAIYDFGTGGGHTIQGNYISTNAAGTVPLGLTGITLSTPNNLIGGTAPGARNVISVTGRDGVYFDDQGAGNDNNTVQGNYIGVGSDGTTPLGTSAAVVIERGVGNTIGGTTPQARNVLGGAQGVVVFGSGGDASGTTIQGNYMGTNAAGMALLSPGGGAGAGVTITDAANTLVGGTAAGAGNVIAGFGNAGVSIVGASAGTVVQGNLIGTNAAGTARLPNNRGVVVFQTTGANTIGGTTAASRNVISGNAGEGIVLTGTGITTVQGNSIGVAADGTTPMGNGAIGVDIAESSGNTVGGTDAGAGNTIAYNGTFPSQGGLRISSGTGNAVVGNAVFSNRGLGLDLGTDGPTANDPADPDAGPNRLQNTPALDAASVRPSLVSVTYRVDAAPANATYPLRVEFFRSRGGEGAAFLGADSYSAADYAACPGVPCAKTATFAPAAPLAAADSVVATATDAAGNTSEFTALAVVPVAGEATASLLETALLAPAPNPTPGRTALRFDLDQPGAVQLTIYDALGREVARLVDAERPAGSHIAMLDAGRLAAGVYVVRLTAAGGGGAGDRVLTRRLVVAR